MSFSSFLRAMGVAIDAYAKKAKREECCHNWQPARTSLGPAKHCAACDTTVQLTTEMYYAQFGKMPHKWY